MTFKSFFQGKKFSFKIIAALAGFREKVAVADYNLTTICQHLRTQLTQSALKYAADCYEL